MLCLFTCLFLSFPTNIAKIKLDNIQIETYEVGGTCRFGWKLPDFKLVAIIPVGQDTFVFQYLAALKEKKESFLFPDIHQCNFEEGGDEEEEQICSTSTLQDIRKFLYQAASNQSFRLMKHTLQKIGEKYYLNAGMKVNDVAWSEGYKDIPERLRLAYKQVQIQYSKGPNQNIEQFIPNRF